MRNSKSAGSVFITAICLLMGLLIIHSCKKSGTTEEGPSKPTTLIIRFANMVDTLPLVLDTMMYKNSSDDFYKVTDLQYFVSDITLHRNDGVVYRALNNDGIHYVDARIPLTLYWTINVSVPSGTFDSISLTFGLNAEKNYSNRFLNPPERDMNWPEVLGGGYHYMKMNLSWQKSGMNRAYPFNFHLGIGQIYKGNIINTDSIERYVQNFFYVNLPASSFSISQGQIRLLVLKMNVNSWFSGNNDFDFAKYPNMMMQNQNAMHNACLNGKNAFTVRFTSGGE
ncbi:MAG: hypothetical protein NTW31_09675 [Bacteroidetes bacterium]|nr:hypothetical protein [Bacteroidota bacterium]